MHAHCFDGNKQLLALTYFDFAIFRGDLNEDILPPIKRSGVRGYPQVL